MAIRSESFKLVFPAIADLPRKSWELDDPTIVDPKGTSVHLYQGEYLSPFLVAGKAKRNTTTGSVPRAFPVYNQFGDYVVQFQKQVTLILGGRFIADTWVFDPAIASLAQKLSAAQVSFDGGNRSILTPATGTDDVVALVLELPGATGQPLRIMANY